MKKYIVMYCCENEIEIIDVCDTHTEAEKSMRKSFLEILEENDLLEDTIEIVNFRKGKSDYIGCDYDIGYDGNMAYIVADDSYSWKIGIID